MRIELLLGLFDSVEVNVCRNLHLEIGAAQHGIEHVIGTLTNVLFQLADILHLLNALLAKTDLVPQLCAEQLAGLINHGHGARFHSGNTARHQIGNRLDLTRFDGLARLHIEHYRCAGFLLIAPHEQRALRNSKMNTGTAYGIEGYDGAGQLPFQGMTITRPFHEFAGTQSGYVVQPFQTRRHGCTHPSCSKRHPDMSKLVFRNQYLTSTLFQTERYLLFLQHLHDVGGIV